MPIRESGETAAPRGLTEGQKPMDTELPKTKRFRVEFGCLELLTVLAALATIFSCFFTILVWIVPQSPWSPVLPWVTRTFSASEPTSLVPENTSAEIAPAEAANVPTATLLPEPATPTAALLPPPPSLGDGGVLATQTAIALMPVAATAEGGANVTGTPLPSPATPTAKPAISTGGGIPVPRQTATATALAKVQGGSAGGLYTDEEPSRFDTAVVLFSLTAVLGTVTVILFFARRIKVV